MKALDPTLAAALEAPAHEATGARAGAQRPADGRADAQAARGHWRGSCAVDSGSGDGTARECGGDVRSADGQRSPCARVCARVNGSNAATAGKRSPTMRRHREAARRDAQCRAQTLEMIATARALEASAPCSCGECESCLDVALLGITATTLATVHTTIASVAERVRTARKRPQADKRPRCGARCRDGHACRAAALWLPGDPAPRNGRCRLHGGLSTGPRTAEGRARSLAALAAARLRRAGR